MAAYDDEWIFVGWVASGPEARAEARALLVQNGFEDRRDEDVRLDIVCSRNETLDARIRVMVSKVPTEPKPKRKPRWPAP